MVGWVEVLGVLDVVGAAEVLGLVDVLGAVDVLGLVEVLVLGAIDADGDAEADGAVDVDGDGDVLGDGLGSVSKLYVYTWAGLRITYLSLANNVCNSTSSDTLNCFKFLLLFKPINPYTSIPSTLILSDSLMYIK